MCGGSSSSQNQIEQEQQQQYQTLSNNYSQVYGEDQNILNGLTSKLNPIINAGPSQQGFSNDELQALNSSAQTSTGQNYGAAQRALQENQAAGGGTSYIPSGAQQEQRGELATAGAGQLSNEQAQIQQADYAQGNENYNQAVSDEMGVAGQLNPIAASGETTGAGSAAGTTANQIAQENNSVWGSVLGALGGVAGAATGLPGISSLFSSATPTLNATGGSDPLGLNVPVVNNVANNLGTGTAAFPGL